MAKTATAKRLVEEKDISVSEAKRWLDADIYLTELELWVPVGLHCDFLLYRMFVHVVATGQKEYDHAICHSRWEPLPVQDLGGRTPICGRAHLHKLNERRYSQNLLGCVPVAKAAGENAL